MTVEIYNKENIDIYFQKFKKLISKLDIYYNPNFLMCDAFLQNGTLEIFTVSKNEKYFIYPYIKIYNKIFTDYFDITSPYGYAGPISNDEIFFQNGEIILLEYLKESGCISEFVRYHYNNKFNFFFKENIQNIHNRNIIIVDLKMNWSKIWQDQFSSTNRNLVNKLDKEKFIYKIQKSNINLKIFIEMYNTTMSNVNANEFYFFKDEYFYELFNKLKNNIYLATVEKNAEIYSCALFFETDLYITYFLSARNHKFKTPATNYLISKTIMYFSNKNYELLNLGGGMSLIEDSLYKFKKNFSINSLPFFIGKRIHNKEIYDKLINNYICKYGEEKYLKNKHILQFYS